MENSSRRVLPGIAREMVYNVYKYFSTEKINNGPIHDFSKAVQRTVEATKLSKSTIHRIWKEAKESEESVLSEKKRKRSKPVTHLDDFDQCALRRTVLNFYIRKEIPTLDKILLEFKENIGFSRSKKHCVKF